MSSRRKVWTGAGLILAIGIVAGAASGGTFAAFGGTTSNGSNSFNAKRIFPGTRSTSAWSPSTRAR